MTKGKIWQPSKHKIRFRNEDMDFYFAWILAHQSENGASFGECFYAAAQVKDGDHESWYTAWVEMARRVESQATQVQEKGHRVSARGVFACLHLLSDGLHFRSPTRLTTAGYLAKGAMVLPTSSGSV